MRSTLGSNEPRDHHCVPKFYLRNFASDPEKLRINSLAKHGDRAIWMDRAIDGIGYEENFYTHTEGGERVSVETLINEQVETPITRSETWQKVASGRTDLLDSSDREVLFSLIRHLHNRTPHYQATISELAEMAGRRDSAIPFTEEEHEMYAEMRADPSFAKASLNWMAASPAWSEASCRDSLIAVYRTPIALYTSTTPVHTAPAPAHPAMDLHLPGTIPHQYLLPLNPTTIASLVIGSFDGEFVNEKVEEVDARVFNRHYVAQFAKFPYVRHLIANRNHLIEDICWSPYELVSDSPLKIVFRRKEKLHA